MSGWSPREIGFVVRRQLDAVGYAARLFFRLCASLGYALKRNGLVRDQIHFWAIIHWPSSACLVCLWALCLVCKGITY